MTTATTNPAKQGGVSIIELLLWLSVFASVAIFAATQFTNITAGAQIERAYAEVEKIKAAALAYRSNPRHGGLFTNIAITVLATQGYNIRPLTTGTGDNVYGRNTTIVSANSNTDATITYQTGSDDACQQLIERFTNAAGVVGAPTCATNTLTLTVD